MEWRSRGVLLGEAPERPGHGHKGNAGSDALSFDRLTDVPSRKLGMEPDLEGGTSKAAARRMVRQRRLKSGGPCEPSAGDSGSFWSLALPPARLG
jgi:hypothetical protein